MAGLRNSFRQGPWTEPDDNHTIWLAEKSILQKNLQHKNQILSTRRNRQLSTLQEDSETTSQFEHIVYTHEDELPFLSIHSLGQGSIAQVDCIVHEAGDDGIPTAELARKVVHLRGSQRRYLLSILQEEVAIMKSLVHEHIIQITSTYETLSVPRQFGILMLPAGDEDLNEFLESVPEKGFQKRDIQQLEKWLLCLASALDYVHSQGIRHRDIKPQNIICKGSEIFLTDFGSAHKFTDTSNTTKKHAGKPIYMYSAPEVISQGERGRSADIFSLGAVYSLMATVITGRRVEDFYDHRIASRPEEPSEPTHMFHATQSKVKSWFEDSSWPAIYDLLGIMLSSEPTYRPRAFEVVATFVSATSRSICKCVHGPILLPKHWDLSIQFELLPGLVEYPSPGSTYGLTIPRAEEILETARRDAEAKTIRRYSEPPRAQTRDKGQHSPDLLGSLLALVKNPGNRDLQKRYSVTEAVSSSGGLNSPKRDREDGGSKHRVSFDIPPLQASPPRPKRDFSSSEPLMVESVEENFI